MAKPNYNTDIGAGGGIAKKAVIPKATVLPKVITAAAFNTVPSPKVDPPLNGSAAERYEEQTPAAIKATNVQSVYLQPVGAADNTEITAKTNQSATQPVLPISISTPAKDPAQIVDPIISEFKSVGNTIVPEALQSNAAVIKTLTGVGETATQPIAEQTKSLLEENAGKKFPWWILIAIVVIILIIKFK